MAIGEELVFPIEKLSSVKSTMSTFAPQWRKKFSGHLDRKSETFTVTRVA